MDLSSYSSRVGRGLSRYADVREACHKSTRSGEVKKTYMTGNLNELIASRGVDPFDKYSDFCVGMSYKYAKSFEAVRNIEDVQTWC